jgi:rare lipoprotein A (peptidoglycan hydrolase)
MRFAFFKHALLAGLLATSLGVCAPLAGPVAAAFADTPTAGGATGSGAASGASSSAPSSSSSSTTTAATATTPSAPAEGGATSGTPAASGVSGGAAPGPAPLSRSLATWFGPGFYGHTTACGQRLTPVLVGVASRTLPCGTLVRIGYHGHHLTVPVLDRGPYAGNGAAWDLTNGAARALGLTDTAHIATQVVGHVANTPTLGEPAPGTASGPTSSSPGTVSGSASSSPGTASGPAPSSATAAAAGGASAG